MLIFSYSLLTVIVHNLGHEFLSMPLGPLCCIELPGNHRKLGCKLQPWNIGEVWGGDVDKTLAFLGFISYGVMIG